MEGVMAAFDAMCGDGLGTAVMGIFGHMEVCEEVLAERKAEHPGRAEEIDGLFICCQCPTVLRREAPEVLYRTHLNQLVDKLLAGESLDTPTGIEMAAMLIGVAEFAPVKYAYMQWLAWSSPETMEAFGVGDYEGHDPGNPHIEETFHRAFEKVGVERDKAYRR